MLLVDTMVNHRLLVSGSFINIWSLVIIQTQISDKYSTAMH